jgi:PHP family Zn ribbon phosphoesterase
VTVGVLHRAERLADRPQEYKPKDAPPFYSLIPLAEVIAETLGVGVTSKAVEMEYQRLIQGLGNEFSILMDVPIADIQRVSSKLVGEGIERMRSGSIYVVPGYDGEYGKVKIFEFAERKEVKGQATLF